MNLFNMEKGIIYHCLAFEESRLFRREGNMLQILNVELWTDYPVVDLRWRFKELPDQRDKCPICYRSMVEVKNAYMFLGKFYTGLFCKPCNITIEGADVPKLSIGESHNDSAI